MRCFKVAAEKVSASVERIHGPLYCVAEATPLDKSAGELNSSGKRLGDLREGLWASSTAACSFSLLSSSRRNANLRRIEKICCAREMGARLVVRAAFFMSPSPTKYETSRLRQRLFRDSVPQRKYKNAQRRARISGAPWLTYCVGVPALRSRETAVTNCAGANGFSRRMLLGTPREGQRPAAAPVM